MKSKVPVAHRRKYQQITGRVGRGHQALQEHNSSFLTLPLTKLCRADIKQHYKIFHAIFYFFPSINHAT